MSTEKTTTKPTARPEQLLAELAALIEKARRRPTGEASWIVKLALTVQEHDTFNRLLDEAGTVCVGHISRSDQMVTGEATGEE